MTAGGRYCVRVYAEKVCGIPPEQVIGKGGTKYGFGTVTSTKDDWKRLFPLEK